MADETRRSGRATKGQYTKDRDIAEAAPAPPPKKGKGKGSKAKPVEEEQDEEEEYIRCVCNTYEEEEDVPRAMICCDNCSAWQHNGCMGLPEDYEADAYFCEKCKPENHKKLLAAIKRGEKPWEAALKKHEEAAEAAKKKRGKKGRKSAGTDERDATPAGTPAAGQKRKAEESPAAPEMKNIKKSRGASTTDSNSKPASAKKGAQTRQPSGAPVVEDVKDLPSARTKFAAALVEIFKTQANEAALAGEFNFPAGETADTVGTRTGLLIENALYNVLSGGSGTPSQPYYGQWRALQHNLKANRQLFMSLTSGDLTPNALATMDPKDMASDEQKNKDAATKKALERQHTMLQESGPRVRRTHKGDELVDEESRQAPEPAQPVRKASTQEQDVKSPNITSPTSANRRQPSVTIPRRQTDPRRQSSANFDIDRINAGIQAASPDGEQRFGQLPTQGTPSRELPGPGTRADAEIDNLLKDEPEETDSPPYSPKAVDSDYVGDVVWRGTVNGGNLGRFDVAAKHACGSRPEDATLKTTWAALLPTEIGINGRIQPTKADEYLINLRYSNSSELLILWIPQPSDLADKAQFDKFFTYFKGKDRFGVGAQSHNAAVKDIYFVPVEQGQLLPLFVREIESNFAEHAAEQMLLMAVVVRNSELPHMAGMADTMMTQSPSMGGPIAQTPITPREMQYDATNGTTPGFQSQTSGLNGGDIHAPASTPLQQPPPQYTSPPPPYAMLAQPPPAAQAAQRILGDTWFNSPAVQQLIQSAPNAGDEEMNVVKECITENAQASQDLQLLTRMLTERWSKQSQSQPPAPT